jgi:hypothetical protein
VRSIRQEILANKWVRCTQGMATWRQELAGTLWEIWAAWAKPFGLFGVKASLWKEF